MTKIVGIGGGTGLPVLLRGLRDLSAGDGRSAGAEISAVVCVADNGGSSGLLRKTFDIPAVGDLRNCLVALSGSNTVLPALFQYRFPAGELIGHSLGNLIVTALCQLSGSFAQAIELAAGLLQLKGCALPATETGTTLCAEFEDGSVARGESQIVAVRRRIQKLWLDPEEPPAALGVLQTIARADALVLGPGSLYTSVVPNLLVAGVADAIRSSPALKIFVSNLMTQPGETEGFSAADHLRALEAYVGPGVIDICVVNTKSITWGAARRYLESGAEPVHCDADRIVERGAIPILEDVLREKDGRVRHDPTKLARLIVSLTRGALRAQDIICGQKDLAC